MPPRTRHDFIPLVLPAVTALVALLLIGDPVSWTTLTIAAIAMGMMMFIMASGLTLVFGLMDVINFGHGAFITVGAYVGLQVTSSLRAWPGTGGLAHDLFVLAAAALVAICVTGLLGIAFERLLIRPVYGQHLRQILITMGGMIIARELVTVLWGADQKPMPLPEALRGGLVAGDLIVEKFRLLAIAIGIGIWALMQLVLKGTRVGLLIRAGVENREMVEALGYPVRWLFAGTFIAGSALAGLGGVMWSLQREILTAGIGGDVMTLVFIIVIIGGPGSVGGCLIGSIMVAMMANYIGYLAPKISLISNIILMLLILLWRPKGLWPLKQW